MWELDYKESWAPKNWCFWTVVLEKTLESPLDCEEIQPVHPKGDQSWVFIETETPILWPPDENWLIGKDPDAGKDWGQEEKGTTEDEMVGWHHRLSGHEFGWIPGVTMDREAWHAAVLWVAKSRTRLSDWTELSLLPFLGLTFNPGAWPGSPKPLRLSNKKRLWWWAEISLELSWTMVTSRDVPGWARAPPLPVPAWSPVSPRPLLSPGTLAALQQDLRDSAHRLPGGRPSGLRSWGSKLPWAPSAPVPGLPCPQGGCGGSSAHALCRNLPDSSTAGPQIWLPGLAIFGRSYFLLPFYKNRGQLPGVAFGAAARALSRISLFDLWLKSDLGALGGHFLECFLMTECKLEFSF